MRFLWGPPLPLPVSRCCRRCGSSPSLWFPRTPLPISLPCSFSSPHGGGCGVCARVQVSLGAPGKRSRVPPREARLLARPPGVAEPPPSRSVWTPARPASVNGTFFSSSGCYLGGSGLGRGRVLWLIEDNPLDQGWGWEMDFFGLPDSPHVRQARGLGLPLAVPCPHVGTCPSLHLPFYSPPFLRAQAGVGHPACVELGGVEGEMGWRLGLGGRVSRLR